jgi:hypothetical protein
VGGRDQEGQGSRPSTKARVYLKSTQHTHTKRAGGSAQVVKHLPNMCKALSSNPSTEERKERKKKGREGGKEGLELWLQW